MIRIPLLISLFFILGCEKQSNELTFISGIQEAALIIGADDRTEIQTSTSLSKMVGQIQSRYAQMPGSQSNCTATLIGKNHLITAAHCVFSPEKGGLAESILFTPDLYRTKKGLQDLYFVEKVYLLKEHVNLRSKDSNFKDFMVASDLAVLRIAEHSENKAAGEVYGFLKVVPTQQEQNVTIVSYPGDKPQGTQWIQEKCALSPYRQFMSVDCDLIVGASGGALIATSHNDFRISGVVSGETATHNLIGILTDPIVSAIRSILHGDKQALFEEYEIHAQAHHRLIVHNDCTEVLLLGVSWKNIDGEDQVDGFHILQPGQSSQVAEMTSHEYAIYAMNPSRSFELKGNLPLEIGGMSVNAVRIQVQGGWQDVNYRVNCVSPQSVN